MELSLRLDTLGIAEVHYLRGRGERYRDWPPFLLLAASRQARILAYMTREAAELLHQQVLTVEEAAGMEVVRELAEELSTDALKLTSRFRCARTGIGFTRAERDEDEDESETEDGENELDLELELALVLQLFEEGRSSADDLPTVELQLDVDDFSHLHETLDFALNRERTSRRRRR